MTVALNGDGGDESFGGYTRYVANALAGRLDLIPGPLRGAVARAGARLPAGGRVTSVGNKARRLAGALALEGPERYASYMSWFDRAQRRELYTAGVRGRRGARGGRDRRFLGATHRARR